MGFYDDRGQPPLYETPEELIEDIADFVIHCEDNGKPLTILGFIKFSRFKDRRSLCDYEQIPEFSHTIKRFKLMVEADLNERLMSEDNDKIPGIIFSLKNNFGWKEKLSKDAHL